MPPRRQITEPHPALGVLRQRRITNRKIAELLGVTPAWVGAMLLGQARVPASFRQALSELLELPEDVLFRPDVPTPRHPGDELLGHREES